ncbi:hypothetical protein A8O14_06215 [Polynucleobacter wuianus]|uniref:DUF1800 domain-containing protein n=1 Tax=Polynucleobacter wuianus TaxID=1743168 RepID=A0A191UF99_9BURK|nr:MULTISPECIES: DUF1800 domain-containing protein [Polynucleobacter]ANI99704.1 hypothetical protein A8O14_06215 [Polynucleobacter wuianus]
MAALFSKAITSTLQSSRNPPPKVSLISPYTFLNRLTFGPNSTSVEEFKKLGLNQWLDWQLRPQFEDDPDCKERMANFLLKIWYPADKEGRWPAVNEKRKFWSLDKSPTELMKIIEPGKNSNYKEQFIPYEEVVFASIIRSIYSQWQVQEVITSFWHNHFSVNAMDGLAKILFPIYDQEVIRPHALGNFRTLLEAVAKSPVMLTYLNNNSSRVGAPNENYAREFFELHTLGVSAYLNNTYSRWKDVPGANNGRPIGYIDHDVRELAKVFTGWTVGNGAPLGDGKNLPRTGEFIYIDAWHDPSPKRVLANELYSNQGPLQDGLRALDLAAYHPATARFISHKLCARLLMDNPPESLVKSAAQVWIAKQHDSHQIAEVIRHIATSAEFANTISTKIKRPIELLASFVRATGQDFTPSDELLFQISFCGQTPYAWPTPEGLPDNNQRWLGASVLLQRWNLISGITENRWGCGVMNPFKLLDLTNKISALTLAKTCLNKIYGAENAPDISKQLMAAAKLAPNDLVSDPAIARRMLAWSAMAPQFQIR